MLAEREKCAEIRDVCIMYTNLAMYLRLRLNILFIILNLFMTV